ncbi:SDR family oxidoreductase [Nocardioides panacisoli]|uniref:SDR family NAD(P)-dependent oxidoreductase n=1 Tax=Nocardioides panacisoli TaxID=627624 RepID=UPI001C6387D4|nr:SDR family oxidoreductase [Nocardioides panacisoli]QYJ02743.1 SDR family oxidoreductase [Nocardioides panacisoli]
MTLPAPSPSTAALVTGASSGIGAAIARELATRGHRVVLVARSEDKLREVADQVVAAGGTADVLPTDLADRAARAELLDRVADLGVTVDVLVNNAGFSTTGPVADADVERELDQVEVDVASVVDLTTRWLPGATQRGRGALLNVASTIAFQPFPGQAGYGAAKAHVLSYTQALAAETKGTGVTVTALCPGPVDTGFVAAAGFTEEEAHGSVPRAMWVSAPAVARAGIDGLAKGRTVVVPGAPNRIGAMLAPLVPRSALLPLIARGHPALRRGRPTR